MRDKHVDIIRYQFNFFGICVGFIRRKEKRYTPEIDSIDCDATIGKIETVFWEKTLDSFMSFTFQYIIVITGDKDLVLIVQRAEPYNEIQHLFTGSGKGDIAGMDNHIGNGQIAQLPMLIVSVREVEDLHLWIELLSI